MFNGAVANLSAKKVNFLSYLEFYYQLIKLQEDEHLNDDILGNHVLCDEWVRLYIDRKKMEKLKSKNTTGGTREEINF